MNKSIQFKIAIITLVALGLFAFIFARPVIVQDQHYHQFVDQREWLGIPNFMDVMSNIFFVIVGILGIREVMKKNELTLKSWVAFFIGILLVGPGSAYYHWSPDDQSLVWDRLPMSLGFMALYTVLLSEHVSLKCEKILYGALFLGISSVVVWVMTTDLRFYFWVQYSSFLTVPLILILFPSLYSQKFWYGVTLLAYGLAKWAEARDVQVFELSDHLMSGHTLKHILAAVGLAGLWWMVKVRKRI